MANFIKNKKVRFNYELQKRYEAGIQLSGIEVKSIRGYKGSLIGSHVVIRGREAFLVGAKIPPYQVNNTPAGYDSKRARKLLLSKKEITELTEFERQKGLTLVPIAVYNSGRNLKLSFAVARGKKKYDKRETIRRREADIEMSRSLKNKR